MNEILFKLCRLLIVCDEKRTEKVVEEFSPVSSVILVGWAGHWLASETIIPVLSIQQKHSLAYAIIPSRMAEKHHTCLLKLEIFENHSAMMRNILGLRKVYSEIL